MSDHADTIRAELTEEQYQWLLYMPSWSTVRGQDVIDTYAAVAQQRDALLAENQRKDLEIETLRAERDRFATIAHEAHVENQRLREQMDAYADDVPALLRDNQRLRDALEQADMVIGLITEYVDDLLDRARAVNASSRARFDAGPFALYAEQRLNELVAKSAALTAVREENDA